MSSSFLYIVAFRPSNNQGSNKLVTLLYKTWLLSVHCTTELEVVTTFRNFRSSLNIQNAIVTPGFLINV